MRMMEVWLCLQGVFEVLKRHHAHRAVHIGGAKNLLHNTLTYRTQSRQYTAPSSSYSAAGFVSMTAAEVSARG